jgi:hypothetical protein
MGLSELTPYMLEMPDGSIVVGTVEMIEELKSLPEDQRHKRLKELEATRDERGLHGQN